MKLIDISRPIAPGMPVWPGDAATVFALSLTLAHGEPVNVGRLQMSVHAGTHTDAPYHYSDVGAKMDEVPPETYVGPARVVDVRGHRFITPALLAAHDFSGTPRVLFRTDYWTDPAVFPPAGWPELAGETPAWLAVRGVKLVGLDVPSVDHRDSKDLPLHHALDRAGIIILESLDLSAVAPGVYELIALPLRLRGGDGSPVRAVLRTRD